MGDGPDTTSSTTAPAQRWRWGGWLHRERDSLVSDLLLGLFLAVLVTATSIWWDGRLSDREDRLEVERATAAQELEDQRAEHAEVAANVEFVRQAAMDQAGVPYYQRIMPFDALNLRGATLTGLDLSGSRMREANLRGTSLAGTELVDAYLWGADLREADLASVDLTSTTLTRADLRNADLRYARLVETWLPAADLTGAVLLEVTFQDVCYDADTRWPADFTPPPSGPCPGLS